MKKTSRAELGAAASDAEAAGLFRVNIVRDIEIEIKVKIEKSKQLISFLRKKAKFIFEKRQIDKYFTPVHRNFISVRPAKEWLRLRSSNNKFSVNYKNWHVDKQGRSYHCDEYETNVENLDQLKKILLVLNFKPLVVVDKLRRTWRYQDYEISLDKVKILGDFVEMEYIGQKPKVNPKRITQEMISFLREHGCGKIERDFVGYPFRLLFPKEAKFEKQ